MKIYVLSLSLEAQFNTTKTSSTKLGGSTTQINFPLSTNQETFWTIKYSSSNVNVNSYPDFCVKDLNGFYKN